MTIAFSKARWDKVREDSIRWWAGDLKRPLIQMRGRRRKADRSEPRILGEAMPYYFDFSVPPEELIDAADYRLSTSEYLGDAFPIIDLDMGPTVIAAYMGAIPENRGDTTWFFPREVKPIAELEFKYDPDNPWLRRHRSVWEAGVERWKGEVLICTPDFGGNLDVVAPFRPGEGLLMDLYDRPDDVKRVAWQAHDLWWRYWDDFQGVCAATNPGYSMPMSIFSTEPTLALQCDFAYMISTEMFDEFVKPELAAMCKRLANPFYHLDGVGQLKHLDSLLTIPNLKGVQWVFGAGKPPAYEWKDVYQKIHDAGKLTQIYCPLGDFDRLVDQLGWSDGIVYINWRANEFSDAETTEFLAKHGVK